MEYDNLYAIKLNGDISLIRALYKERKAQVSLLRFIISGAHCSRYITRRQTREVRGEVS